MAAVLPLVNVQETFFVDSLITWHKPERMRFKLPPSNNARKVGDRTGFGCLCNVSLITAHMGTVPEVSGISEIAAPVPAKVDRKRRTRKVQRKRKPEIELVLERMRRSQASAHLSRIPLRVPVCDLTNYGPVGILETTLRYLKFLKNHSVDLDSVGKEFRTEKSSRKSSGRRKSKSSQSPEARELVESKTIPKVLADLFVYD